MSEEGNKASKERDVETGDVVSNYALLLIAKGSREYLGLTTV